MTDNVNVSLPGRLEGKLTQKLLTLYILIFFTKNVLEILLIFQYKFALLEKLVLPQFIKIVGNILYVYCKTIRNVSQFNFITLISRFKLILLKLYLDQHVHFLLQFSILIQVMFFLTKHKLSLLKK
ncbi:hypothetical protein WQ54_00210 [Bacillus sp. SA1-12]|nr:hypothetical protein WQ54_00210 [Bacillus sp. SA1-12]